MIAQGGNNGAAAGGARAGGYTLEVSRSPEGWDDPAVRERWGELVRGSESVNVMYASPEWFDLLRETAPASELALAVARDGGGAVAGVVPLQLGSHALQFDVSSRTLHTSRLRAAVVLGSVPMLPPDAALHSRLYSLLLAPELGRDCVYMDAVPGGSLCARPEPRAGRGAHLTYVPYGSRQSHLLRLGGSAQDHFSKMSSKARGNLHRSIKQLKARGGGRLELVRVEAEGEVDEFLREAAAVSRKTWQHKILGSRVSDTEEERAGFRARARRGLLRSYTLRCGDEPCAFVVGHQYGGVYHYNEVGYDPAYASFSPGTVLLYLLIQDLFAHRPPRLLNFGVGDADYKRRFGNVQMEDASVLVFRKSLRGRLLTASHSGFRALVKAARGVVRRSQRV